MCLPATSELNNSSLFMPGVWTVTARLYAICTCLVNWSTTAESYLVFAIVPNCWERRLRSSWTWKILLKRSIFLTSFFSFLLPLLHFWWATGKFEPLPKVGCKKMYAHTCGLVISSIFVFRLRSLSHSLGKLVTKLSKYNTFFTFLFYFHFILLIF